MGAAAYAQGWPKSSKRSMRSTPCSRKRTDTAGVTVVTTSFPRQVHVFDTQGGKIKDINVSCYTDMVRVAEGHKGADLILADQTAIAVVLSPSART